MSILNKLTLSQIKENKKRTVLTTLSIAMIVSLLTAIVLFLTSMWFFAYQAITDTTGDYHFRTNVISSQQVTDLKQASFTDGIVALPSEKLMIYSKNSETNEKTETLVISEYEAMPNAFSYLYQGKLPQNDQQIAVSTAVFNEQGVDIGQTITVSNGVIEKTYTISGIFLGDKQDKSQVLIKRNDFNATTFTVFGKSNVLNQNYFSTLKTYSQHSGVQFEKHNNALLSIYLIIANTQIDHLVKVILPIVISLVVIIAIVVISSSFLLSLNERLKQLGALSSIGTTRQQIISMMLRESLILGSLGIVLGLIIGFVGTSVSLHYFNEYAQQLINYDTTAIFELHVYLPTILSVVVLSLFIIVVSSIVPSIRASKRTPIDNIKQVPFAKLFTMKKRPKKVKKNFLFKLFGYPAFLAHRYQKHYASRSRLVFVILTISLMTFNVIASLLLYATNTVERVSHYGFKNNIYTTASFIITDYHNTLTNDATANIKAVDGVTDVFTMQFAPGTIIDEDLKHNFIHGREDGDYPLLFVSLSPNMEEALLKKLNVSTADFANKGIIVWDTFNDGKRNFEAPVGKWQNKILPFSFNIIDENNKIATKKTMDITIMNTIHADDVSFDLPNYAVVVISQVLMKQVNPSEKIITLMAIQAQKDKHTQVAKHIQSVLKDLDARLFLNDVYGQQRSFIGFLGMVQIIVYGFLSLVSVICLLTFFNTITANVRLRQREFAMVQSIGMTTKQLRRMLSIEHLKSAIKSLVIAVTVSYGVIVFVLNNIARRESGTFEWGIPVLPMLISSIIFISILVLFNVLTMRQAFRQSIVEIIRNETT